MTHDTKMELTEIGCVTITPDGTIYVAGFTTNPPGSCREVANLATAWALCHLSTELAANLREPGGGKIVID